MKLSQRAKQLAPSSTLKMGAKAKALQAQGRDITMLTLGEPDFVTPDFIAQAAQEAISSGRASYYTQADGLPELKTAIADYFATYYGYSVDQSQIMVATGAKFVLYLFFMAVLDPEDEVIVPAPYWVSYVDQIQLAQGKAVIVETAEKAQFKVSVAQLEAARTPKTRAIIINSPSNPTGSIYSAEELQVIGEWALQHDILILADDIYGRLTYSDATFTPIASLSSAIRKQTITISGVSKTYAMTGWRIGFAVGDQAIISAMAKLASQTTSNPTTVAQYATIAALSGPQDKVDEMRQVFEDRLNVFYPLIAQLPGFQLHKPQGAFYLFPNVEEALKLTGYADVDSFAEAILEEAGVAVVSGTGFGSSKHIRLSYASDQATLEIGAKKIADWLDKKIKAHASLS